VHLFGSYYTDLFRKLSEIYQKRVCQRVSSQRPPPPKKRGQNTERIHFDTASIIQENLIYSFFEIS